VDDLPLSDTHPEIARQQIEQLRQMPAWRKLALASDMTETIKSLALAGLRQRYPDEPPAHHHRRLADLLLGPDLALRAYGPLPASEQDDAN
jgi:hypothetical protein